MTDEELQLLTEEISLKFFGKAFLHEATFNHRLRTTGGRYLLKTNNIEINKKYYDRLGHEELVGIIKHELVHYHLHIAGKGYNHRDADFKKLLKEVGAPRHCSAIPELRNKETRKTLVYICENCRTIYKRKRRVNVERYRCGKCRGKLVLQS